MIETLNQYDHQLMLWLNYDGGSFADAFWYAVSYKFTWVPLYLIILIQVLRYAHLCPFRGSNMKSFFSRYRHAIILLLVTIAIVAFADQIASGIIKPLVQRLRPSHQPGVMEQLHYVNGYHGGTYGFVSSHASNTIALTVWIAHLLRSRLLTFSMLSFFAVNCYSRIYLGVHYFGDIVCGALVGILSAGLGFYIYRRLTMGRITLGSSSGCKTFYPIILTFWATIIAIMLIALLN